MRASRRWIGKAAGTAVVAGVALAFGQAGAVDRDAWLKRVERSRQVCAAFVGSAIERRDRRGASPSTSVVDRSDSFADPTLRYGDIIVRAEKLVVFRGLPGEQRTPSDFQDLTGERLGGVHDHELRAIDTLVRLARPAGPVP